MELHGAFSIGLRAPGTEFLSRFGFCIARRYCAELLLGCCGVSPLERVAAEWAGCFSQAHSGDRGRPTPTKLIEGRDLSVKARVTDPIVEHRELLEDFFLECLPNPDRIGCPDDDAMQNLAENGPVANDPVLRHVSSCSDCYREYRHYRQDAKERKAGLLPPLSTTH